VRLQLLERDDEKKWFVWSAVGLLTAKKVKTQHTSYFSKVGAIAEFEKKFEGYTENRWVEKEFFQAKPGKYQIVSEQREKEKLELAVNEETEIKTLLDKALANTDEFMKFVWSVDMAKKAMRDMQLDTGKLPFGLLKIERIKKSLQILAKIYKQI
jgi:Poly(ADP-ribose) polymerase, regulatory domain